MRVQSSRLVFLTRYRTKFREFLGEAISRPSLPTISASKNGSVRTLLSVIGTPSGYG